MKKLFIYSLAVLALSFTACNDDDDPGTTTIDTSMPTGTFTADLSGDFVEQNGTGSMGDVDLGTDSDGDTFLRFGSNFNTNLATGTVTVYFSTTMDFMTDPGSGNPDLYLVGAVRNAGENYFKLDDPVPAKFTHVILWCGSANIPFGYAAIN